MLLIYWHDILDEVEIKYVPRDMGHSSFGAVTHQSSMQGQGEIAKKKERKHKSKVTG